MNSINGFAFFSFKRAGYFLHWDGRKVFDLTKKIFILQALQAFAF